MKVQKLTKSYCYNTWENPANSEFYDFLVSYKFDKLYHRVNTRSSFRDCALCCGDTALCLRSRHTPNDREMTV